MYDPFNHVYEIELYWLQSFFAAPLLLEYDSNPPPFLSLLCSTLLLSLSLSLSLLSPGQLISCWSVVSEHGW